MQEIRFFKYQGAGNDFVVLDNRKGEFSFLSAKQIALLCHRRFGIGADGLIRLEEAAQGRFRMAFFNSDGKEGSMCGNGGRCICAFALSLGLVKRDETFSFEAPDGLHEACILEENDDVNGVALKMRDVSAWKFDEKRHIYLMDTGSPHYIRFVEDCDEADVVNEGKRIRCSEEFPEGINVDFVEIVKGEEALRVRTYERGVEDETFACGTGVTAAALAFALEKKESGTHHDIRIHTRGGDLRVAFDRVAGEGAAPQGNCVFRSITLTGPACKVFEGVYCV